MTLRDALLWLGQHPWALAILFIIPPTASLLAGAIHGRGRGDLSPWKYLYSVLIYWVSVPGMAALVMTAYSVVFARENLLDLDVMVSIVPILSMVITLVLVRRNVDFDQVPGFDRLFGLMVALAITFVLILGISKTRIWLFFGSSILNLLLLTVVLIAAAVWGTRLAFGRRA
jgi:hypothetical protein